MNSYKRLTNIAGWLVFAVTAFVFFLSAERTGSLWDCGEFILGAHKLQVVHPPGAPFFLIVGRMFTYLAELFTDTEAHPENIAFAVNLMSGICTAFAATFVCWVTIMFGKLAMVGRNSEPSDNQTIALSGAGIVAGLSTAFCSSIWFSAVEGEVYAMSTFFTCLTLWSMTKWYSLPDSPKNDRWIAFTVYAGGLSIGVHLLSLLTFPALAMLYYFKKYKNHSFLGMAAAAAGGVAVFVFIQKAIITGIPGLWRLMELMTVNGLGLPFHSGLIPTILIVGAIFYFGLRYAHQKKNPLLQLIFISSALVVIAFSTIGVVIIRANANTPINMNDPSDPMRLLPYLNREQYGERPLLYGPTFTAEPVNNEIEERYGQVTKDEKGNPIEEYAIVDEKVSYVYKDKVFFPRMTDNTQGRPEKYRSWIDKPNGEPNFFDNLEFTFKYQLGWMYWRYFLWNFAGRQNGEQGFYNWDKKSGHWISGLTPLDEARLYNMDELPETMKNDQARNRYFMLPLIFGLLGLFFHFKNNTNDALGLLALFIITGIGIIIYSNQPPNEPRERDYVLAGSFFTFSIWIGMGVLAVYQLLREKVKMAGTMPAILASLIVLSAPVIMGFENFDDHTRAHHSGARDYAANFLESCEPNAIIFTYGDNDTYPLWYAQEVEGIRTDVRVVNLSLIAVDWYIDQLRRKVNDSPPIKMTVPRDAYRGRKRNTVLYYNNSGQDREMTAEQFLQFIGEEHVLRGQSGRTLHSYMPTRKVYLPVDKNKVLNEGILPASDSANVVGRIPIKLSGKSYLIKDELAVLDVIVSNIWERPVYFAVTCRPEKMFGLQDYMQLEGLGLRIIPVKTKSEQGLYVYGNGRVSVDHVYDNVMNKFRWGNFDKEEAYINTSYGPSIQSHRVIIMRTARQLQRGGDNERAIALLEKYFEAFPHKNFHYDFNSWQMLKIMLDADGYENAKPHLKILAYETADYLEFYESLDPRHLERDSGSFWQDYELSMGSMSYLLSEVKKQKDEEFSKELEELFKPFGGAQLQIPD